MASFRGHPAASGKAAAPGSDSDGSSSEYETDSSDDSDDGLGPVLLKPVFRRKEDRVTAKEAERRQAEEAEKERQRLAKLEERKAETMELVASEIKKEEAGDAFEPGDVFWDPLAILQDAPPSMRRNFQQRELFNGRIAMLAVACFFFEEALTHKPLITGRISQFLFEPAYEIPEIQAFFDSLFGSQGASPVFVEPDGPINPIRVLLEEEADKVVEAELSGGGPSDILNDQSTIEPYSMKYNK